MYRYNIINALIRRNNYKRYLEIGTQAEVCLSKVNCEYKIGVDPEPVQHDPANCTKFYKKTSDDFFCENQEKFDIIFIDGLHEKNQVYKDVFESLDILTPGGSIIVHDCNPIERRAQRPARMEDDKWIIPHVPEWNGDVWKAWIKLRLKRGDLSMYVVDVDQGCGVIQRGSQNPIKIDIGVGQVNYDHLEANRKEWLNLISVEEFRKLK